MSKNIIDQTAQESNTLTSKDNATSCSIDDKTKKSTKKPKTPKASKAKKKTGKDGTKSTSKAKSKKKDSKEDEKNEPVGTDDEVCREEKPTTSQELLDKIQAVTAFKSYCSVTGKPLHFYIPDFKKNLRKLTYNVIKTEEEAKANCLKIIDIMNCCFSRVALGADTCIVKFKKKKDTAGLVMDVLTFEQFKKLFSNMNQVTVYFDARGKAVKKDIATHWFESSRANDGYEGMNMMPDEAPLSIKDNWFNTWQGFGVNDLKADETDTQIAKYLYHLKVIICDNNPEHYNELLRFLAHFRQKPYVKPLYDIILESEEQGTGKSTFLQPLLTLAGAHGTELKKASSLTGRFNGKLANKTFVVAEEAFAGSQETTNVIKNLNTSPHFELELKHKDSTDVTNYLRLFFTTNQEDILKVDLTERRHFYLKVSAEKMLNKEYFDGLAFTWGKHKDHVLFVSKLSYYLNNYYIDDNYIPKNPPRTELLALKQLNNLSQEHFFVFVILFFQSNHYTGLWAEQMTNVELMEHYAFIKKLHHTKNTRSEGKSPVTSVAMLLGKLGLKNYRSGNIKGWITPQSDIPRLRSAFCKLIKQSISIFATGEECTNYTPIEIQHNPVSKECKNHKPTEKIPKPVNNNHEKAHQDTETNDFDTPEDIEQSTKATDFDMF